MIDTSAASDYKNVILTDTWTITPPGVYKPKTNNLNASNNWKILSEQLQDSNIIGSHYNINFHTENPCTEQKAIIAVKFSDSAIEKGYQFYGNGLYMAFQTEKYPMKIKSSYKINGRTNKDQNGLLLTITDVPIDFRNYPSLEFSILHPNEALQFNKSEVTPYMPIPFRFIVHDETSIYVSPDPTIGVGRTSGSN